MPTAPSTRALVAAIRAAVADVPSALRAAEALASQTPQSALTIAVADALDCYLEDAVYHYGSTVTAAAALGVPRRTLQWRVAKAKRRRQAA